MAATESTHPMAGTVERAREAKEPVTVLAGPYGHPFHPILVTVPIGAWVASLVFDITTRVQDGGNAALVEGAYWLIGIGIVGALLAAVFGLLDLVGIPRRTRAFRVGLTHMVLNLGVVGLFVADFLLRSDYEEYVETETTPLVVSIVALVLLGVSGYLGGMLAYRYGVRVADEDTQAQGFS